MKLESQVCSLELARCLKELGVKQDSLFYHLIGGIASRIEALPLMGEDWYSAFTVAELGKMLPRQVFSKEVSYFIKFYRTADDDFVILYEGYIENKLYIEIDENEADARAKMLIYLIENKLIEV